MTNHPVPTPPLSRGAIIMSKVRQAARQAAVAAPVAVGAGATVAALALPHGWFHSAVEAVQAIGLGNVLVLAVGAVGMRWGERIGSFLVPQILAANDKLGAIAATGLGNDLFLKRAAAESTEDRAAQAVRLEELAEDANRDHADLAESMRRCEANALAAAHSAEAARVEVVHLAAQMKVGMERAVANADLAATEAARAAYICAALAQELQYEGVVPPPAPIKPPIPPKS
jgi:hypothetical protein